MKSGKRLLVFLLVLLMLSSFIAMFAMPLISAQDTDPGDLLDSGPGTREEGYESVPAGEPTTLCDKIFSEGERGYWYEKCNLWVIGGEVTDENRGAIGEMIKWFMLVLII